MKVIILAGGMGTRLSEETEVRPKPMVEVGGRPILWHIMKHYAHYGFKEFVAALGYKGDSIKRYFLDYALLRASTLPAFETVLAEDPTEGNPLRIKGGGESGITPSLPVLVNAVVDALRPLGVTDLEMPLTPSRVWAAIELARCGQEAALHTPPE